MRFKEESYQILRALLKEPLTSVHAAGITGGNSWHVRERMDRMLAHGFLTKEGTRYQLTNAGVEALKAHDGVEYEIQYKTSGRIHPNIDWPWEYREAA